MPKLQITKILSIVEKPNYKGEKGYLITVLADQDEATHWTTDKDKYKVGDPINVFFDDKWHSVKFE